jgi:hypothetical protein
MAIGVFVDPARIAEASAFGASLNEIRRRAIAGELRLRQEPLEIPSER